MNHLIFALAMVFVVGCGPMNGVLTVKASDSAPAALRDVYTVMTSNGFLMKKPQSTETYSEEKWFESDTSTSGAFMDPSYAQLVVVVMYLKSARELLVIFDESTTGFSAEGQAKTDTAVRALKERFGDKVAISERRNYKGTE